MTFIHRILRPLKAVGRWHAGHPLRVFSTTLKAYLFLHAFCHFGYIIEPAEGPSMLPTFEVYGDWFLISKQYRKGRGIEVGDIVASGSVVEPGQKIIKRVLGLEGDYVMRNTPETGSVEMIQVPEGHCWVVGDNMTLSRDSRHFGPMPMGLIRGKIIAKVFPWNERRWILNELTPVQTNRAV